MLAPRGGKVSLAQDGYITLTDIKPREGKVHNPERTKSHIVPKEGNGDRTRLALLESGAWQFFSDAYTKELPDPKGTPQGIIVSTLSLEPFVARGDVQLADRLLEFTRGLEHLQTLLEYQPIYLVVPNVKSELIRSIKERVRGYAWIKLVAIPVQYPYDDSNLLARHIGLKKADGPIWSARTEGVLAVDRALTAGRPCLTRLISIGGPGAKDAVHLKAIAGYPIKKIVDDYAKGDVRVINGGILAGAEHKSLGLEAECRGLTLLPEQTEREFLSFVRPGYDRKSYSASFLSSLRGKFAERLTTSMRGEGRPCVACHYCADICPAGLSPFLLHKYLYADMIEQVEKARVDLCVECGLCSYVCPSKIELAGEFIKAKELIEQEKEEIRIEQARKAALEEAQKLAKQEKEAAK
ncbi:MAG: 4Fe-4S dicluster domain-containing protein [Phycisphaerae bacterium]|nr:4Fe-4S dicluster domain-containing protein [Phycisphaerae bacterium]